MKDVAGQEGRYAVTEDGRVWSHLTSRFLKTKLMGGNKGRRYDGVTLTRNGRGYSVYVHRLVAAAFIPNPANKPTVNHKDGNKQNNSVQNLEWATHTEQRFHAMGIGLLLMVGEDNPQAKLTAEQVDEIRQKYLFDRTTTQDSLATEYGVHRVLIKEIVTGERWAHTWKPEYERPPRWKDSGVHNKNSKYTPELADEIKRRYAAGGCTTRSLAKEFGIHSSTVSMINRGLTWCN